MCIRDRISLVEQWQQYRMKPGVTCKADVDKKFVTLCGLEYPDKEISVDILYQMCIRDSHENIDFLEKKIEQYQNDLEASKAEYDRCV